MTAHTLLKTSAVLSLALAAGCTDASAPADSDEASAELGTLHGLSAEYFQGTTLDPHNRLIARIEPNIDAQWGAGSPDPAVPVDQFSARWTGKIVPRFSERYTLSFPKVDDTARVLIDGVVIIDHAGWFTPTSGTVTLQAGHPHAIVVEYAEQWGAAEIQLAWQSASQAFETVPSSQLTPAPTPPPQPATGPGGQDYPHAGCTLTERPAGWNDDLTYWVLEPASPAPASAPLVVFDHGWMGNAPSFYARWINHLCRRGNVVIFPKYQNLLTPTAFFLSNAVWSVHDALAFLATPGHVRPETELGMIVVGHSAGGTVAADMADTWQANHLPFPRAMFAVNPPVDSVVPFTALDKIPATTAVACMVANEDTGVGRGGCDTIFDRTPQVPNKRYLWGFSDDHGAPSLLADHFAASEGPGNYTDAIDYFVIWKMADALRDCAFANTSCGLEPRALGTWSDGTPVVQATVTIDAKPACPAGSPALGCAP